MSNKKQFQDNLFARVRIRPLVHYANLGKYLDEEWIIDEIQDKWFKVSIPSGYFVIISHDVRREWVDDFSKLDGLKRGTIMLKGQVILRDGRSNVEPLTDSLLTEAMRRAPDK